MPARSEEPSHVLKVEAGKGDLNGDLLGFQDELC